MIMRTCIGTLSFWAIVYSASVAAAPIDPFDLRKLIADADVIVEGVVRTPNGDDATVVTPNENQELIANVAIAQVLKGSVTEKSIRFRSPATVRIGDNAYRIVFLRRRGNSYEVVSPHFPTVVTVPGPGVQADTDEERVLKVIARATATSLPTEVIREAIHALWGVTNPGVLTSIAQSLDHPNREIQLTAAAALLAANDLRGLSAAEIALSETQAEADEHLLHNLRVAISEGVADSEAVPSLSRLLTHGDDATRSAVVSSLSRIADRSVIPELLRSLDDRDFEVRLNAVRGLAERSGRMELVPSWDAFLEQESTYTQPLRRWAQEQSKAK
jgi:hypothetical protein